MKKAKSNKSSSYVLGSVVGKVIVFSLVFLMLIAILSLLVVSVWGFIMLMKGVFNGF